MKLITSALLAAALVAPAVAQQMGSTNRNAPTVEQKVSYPNGLAVTLNYTSITWAAGNWAKVLEDQSRRDAARKRYNDSAENSPLGTFATKTDITVGGQSVAAGEYKLMFKLDDQFAWTIVLKSDSSTITVPLQLMDGGGEGQEHQRLVLALYASGTKAAGIYLGFGNKMGMIDISAGAPDGEKKAEEASAEKADPKKEKAKDGDR